MAYSKEGSIEALTAAEAPIGRSEPSAIPEEREEAMGEREVAPTPDTEDDTGIPHGRENVDADVPPPKAEADISRVIYGNDPVRNLAFKYADNHIRTTKYTWWNFLPKNLFEQFHRFANIYFLSIIILNWIPQINAFGKEVAMLPLLFVLAVTAIKDAYEDRRRRLSDHEVNNRLGNVLDRTTGQFAPKPWKQIVVGDIVKLMNDEIVPADILLLNTSEAYQLCFIETANLDGETNLKQRRAPSETSKPADGAEFNPAAFSGSITCELPNPRIYEFNGVLNTQGRQAAVDSTNLILRGCVVRNTREVVGIVVYAGHETKAMLNNSGPRSKRSKLERMMNTEILACVGILLVMCLACAFAYPAWMDKINYEYNLYYWFVPGDDPRPALAGFLNFWRMIIVLQVIIPISLYVTMEIVKLGQVFFIANDVELYDEENDKPINCRALNITEDLGQIEYVFSDKTGTLTENKMIFRKCTIGGFNYAHTGRMPHSTSTTSLQAAGAADVPSGAQLHESIAFPGGPAALPSPFMLDPMLVQAISDPSSNPAVAAAAENFFLALALCNNAMPARKKDDAAANPAVNRPIYESESPDEVALVTAARIYGYGLESRSQHSITVNVRGKPVTYELLNVFEFDSDRKRMSVIVRMPDGRLRLFIKGADSIILSRLRNAPGGGAAKEGSRPGSRKGSVVRGPGVQDDDGREETKKHLDYYASDGLRTLCIAYKDIDEKAYDAWVGSFRQASVAIENRAQKVSAVAEVMERDLVLIGATGIEDKLQKGVPESIAMLRHAGIKVWVLTGDKQETAINIAFSCQLFAQDMHHIILNALDFDECEKLITDALGRMDRRASFAPVEGQRRSSEGSAGADREYALIIDGATLAYALKPELRDKLLQLSSKCKSVVCCRTTPSQKAEVVRLVKEGKKAMTLAIGDGANDVSMIQMADIGIGISGQEGMQAVMASDFAISQFRFLVRLLLVHGHWSYQRLATMVLYFFYKNAAFVFLLFWYEFYCGWSGATVIDQYYLFLYNLIWTSLPPIITAVFDQDVTADALMERPDLYLLGLRGMVYTRRRFWLTICDALYQSILIFFFVLGIYHAGDYADVQTLGLVWNTVLVVTVNLQMGLETNHWTWISHFVIWGSIIVYWLFAIVYNAIASIGGSYWVIETAMGTGVFWLTLLLTIPSALLPRYVAKFIKHWHFPSPIDGARLEHKFGTKGDAETANAAAPDAAGVSRPPSGSGSVDDRDCDDSSFAMRIFRRFSRRTSAVPASTVTIDRRDTTMSPTAPVLHNAV
eukprot:Opistho-1_new@21219